MAYAFNEDRSKVDVYTEDEIDAMHIVDKETIDAKNAEQDQAIADEAAARILADNTTNARIDTLVDHGTGGIEVRELLWQQAGGVNSGTIDLPVDFDAANYDCLECECGVAYPSWKTVSYQRIPVTGGTLHSAESDGSNDAMFTALTLSVSGTVVTCGNAGNASSGDGGSTWGVASASVMVSKIYGIKYAQDCSAEVADIRVDAIAHTHSVAGDSTRMQGKHAFCSNEIEYVVNDGWIYTNGSFQAESDPAHRRMTDDIGIRLDDTLSFEISYPESKSSVWYGVALYASDKTFIKTVILLNNQTGDFFSGHYTVDEATAAYIRFMYNSYDGNYNLRIFSTNSTPETRDIVFEKVSVPYTLASGDLYYNNGSISAGNQGAGQKKQKYTETYIPVPLDGKIYIGLEYDAKASMTNTICYYDANYAFLSGSRFINGNNAMSQHRCLQAPSGAVYYRVGFNSWEDTQHGSLSIQHNFSKNVVKEPNTSLSLFQLNKDNYRYGYADSFSSDSQWGLSAASAGPRIINIEPMKLYKGTKITFKSSTTIFEAWIDIYDDDGNPSSLVNDWKTWPYVFEIPNDCYARAYFSIVGHRYDTAYVPSPTILDDLVADIIIEVPVFEFPETFEKPESKLIGNALDIDVYKVTTDDEYMESLDLARRATMESFAGDMSKIPFILHTDQHSTMSYNTIGVWRAITDMFNWDNISACINLGDTVQNNWPSSNGVYTDPYMYNKHLEEYNISIASVPKDKRIEVIGNHDTWGPNWDGNSTGDKSIPVNYLMPYFSNNRLNTKAVPDSSGNFVVYDSYFMVKYVVLASWDYADTSTNSENVSSDHIAWLIDQFSQDDGYDIVLLSHIPVHFSANASVDPFTSETLSNPASSITNGSPYLTQIVSDRKSKVSGSFTDKHSITHQYDFTNVNGDLLCALCGHVHYDGYQYLDSNVLSVAFEHYINQRAIFFCIIDRKNRQIEIRKVCSNGTVGYNEAYVSLDN